MWGSGSCRSFLFRGYGCLSLFWHDVTVDYRRALLHRKFDLNLFLSRKSIAPGCWEEMGGGTT